MKFALIVALTVASALAKPSFHPRVVGGRDADAGEYPYQISYQWGFLGTWQHMCGGSILSPNWIVTAGHCVTEVPAYGDFKIVAGITLLSDTHGQEINVVEKIVNPNYVGGVGPNDIALLRLEKPLELNDLVQPISLPTANADASGDVVISGWGSTSTGFIPINPDHLQTEDLPLLTFDECKTALDALLDDNPLDAESNVCTGPLTGGLGACNGDSGGPIVQDGGLIGVVSWGMVPCGYPGAPSVYTNVANFIDFITENVSDLPK